MVHGRYGRRNADLRIRVSVLPPTGGSGPAIHGPGAHALRTLRRRTAQGLLGRGRRVQGQWLLQDRQSRRREIVHPAHFDDPRGGVNDGVNVNAGRDTGLDVRDDIVVDHFERLTTGDRDVVDRDRLTGGGTRKPFLVVADLCDVEQHPLQRRGDGDLAYRLRELAVTDHESGHAH